MSIAKGEIEDDFSTKDSFHSNKDTRANDNSDNILADSLDVVHNFDDANNVVTEQLSSNGEKGQADGLSFISISNDNRSLDPNATSSFVIHTDDFGDMNQIDNEEKTKKGLVPILPNVSILYPLKVPENQSFLVFSTVVKWKHLPKLG